MMTQDFLENIIVYDDTKTVYMRYSTKRQRFILADRETGSVVWEQDQAQDLEFYQKQEPKWFIELCKHMVYDYKCFLDGWGALGYQVRVYSSGFVKLTQTAE